MRPDLIIELDVTVEPLLRVTNRLVRVEIDLLILEAPPEAFHIYVIPPTAAGIHTDLDALVIQQTRELQTGKLTALIGVEDLRMAILRDRLPHRVEAEVRGQRIGEPPRQHSATRPVQDGEERHEAPTHGNVGEVRRPDVVRANDLQTAQTIGVDPMGRMPLSGAGLAIHGGDPHAPHEAGHTPPPNGLAVLSEESAQHPSPGKGILEMQLVNPAHQGQFAIGHGRRLIVGRRACHAEQLALPNDRQGMSSVDHRVALSTPALMSAPSKNRSPAPVARSSRDAS